MAKQSISQQRIAKDLGVSQSLVSIVLNGRREGIAQETYERIWKHALDHGYSPKGMKVHLAGDPGAVQQTVGYFLRSPLRLATKSNFFSHVHQGLHDYLHEHRINVVFLGSESDFDPDKLNRLAWQLKFLKGIAIMGEVAPAFLYAVRAMGKPVVYISARCPGMVHSVNSNENQAGEQLVDHLHDLGHRHFAYLGGMCARSRHFERLSAIQQALRMRGLEIPETARHGLPEAERNEGYEVAETLLARRLRPFPTAWIAVNGLLARGALTSLLTHGYKIGKDVSVAAFDMTRVMSHEPPGITGASAVPEELGRAAGRILLEVADKPTDQYYDLVLPSRLEVRESTGPVVSRAVSA